MYIFYDVLKLSNYFSNHKKIYNDNSYTKSKKNGLITILSSVTHGKES